MDKPVTRILTADYNGVPVAFMGDGWFNATVAAAKFGKHPYEWLRLPETNRHIQALENRYGKIPLLNVERGGRGKGGATWMHPKLAVPFARWLDADFAVWCDEQIDHILRGGLSIWEKAAGERSDTADREPLLTAAAAIVARHRLPFGSVYEQLNLFAGVAHAREMNCEQVLDAAGFAERVLAGNATSEDFARLERNRARLAGGPAQIPLLGDALLGGA